MDGVKLDNQDKEKDLYKILRAQTKDKYNRVLPFSELIVNRWEKAIFCGFGENTSVYDSAIIMGDVRVGHDVWIGPNTILDGSGGELSIGDFCCVSADTHIYTHDTVDNCLSGGTSNRKQGSVSIGSCVYLAPKVIISLGVTLGNHCLVCANSFVNKSFPDYSIIGGTPARKIGEIFITEFGEVRKTYFSNGSIP